MLKKMEIICYNETDILELLDDRLKKIWDEFVSDFTQGAELIDFYLEGDFGSHFDDGLREIGEILNKNIKDRPEKDSVPVWINRF